MCLTAPSSCYFFTGFLFPSLSFGSPSFWSTKEAFRKTQRTKLLPFFPKQFTVGFSLRKKRLAAICSGRVSGACLPCVRLVSATCPPCVVGFGRVSGACPPCVVGFGRVSGACPPCVVGFGRLALLAVAAPPVLVRHLFALCPPLVRLVLLALAAPPALVRHLSALCPPLVRLVLLALAAPPVLVRHLSALCPPLVRLVLLALAAPPVFVRLLSALCPPLVRLVGFGRASSPCPPLVRLVMLALATSPELVRLVSATCPPCVVGFGRASSPCPSVVGFGRASSPCPPCVVGFGHVPRACRPCVRHPPLARHVSTSCLVSGLSPLWPRFQTLSTMCPPCVCNFVCYVSALRPSLCPPCLGLCPGLRPALAASPNLVGHRPGPCVRPCLHFGLASNLNLVCHVSALPFVHHVSAKALPLVFVSSWPAVGQGRGIIRQNSFAPLRNPQRLYCRPAGQFPLYIHQSRPLQGHLMLEKLFGVYAGIICFFL